MKKDQLAAAITYVLENKSFEKNMLMLKRYQDRYDGPEKVAEALLEKT